MDQSAGLAPVSCGLVAGLVWPTLGAGGFLQGVESRYAFDSVFAEPHALDGPARNRRADPGLCRVGGLPPRGRHGGCGRGVAHQFLEDPASGARVVAVLGGLSGFAEPGAGALGRAPFLVPDRGYGHPQATATVLPASVAPTGEQLATVAQKHLPQRTCPIRRWPNPCLNRYTALCLNGLIPLHRKLFG